MGDQLGRRGGWSVGLAFTVMALLSACGDDGSSNDAAEPSESTTAPAVGDANDPAVDDESEPATTLPQLAEAECAVLTDFMEHGAPSPIDGSVTVDLAALPEAAQPAAEVLVASYQDVLAQLRSGELPNVDEDVSGLVEVAEQMSAPEIVAAVEQLEGMVSSC